FPAHMQHQFIPPLNPYQSVAPHFQGNVCGGLYTIPTYGLVNPPGMNPNFTHQHYPTINVNPGLVLPTVNGYTHPAGSNHITQRQNHLGHQTTANHIPHIQNHPGQVNSRRVGSFPGQPLISSGYRTSNHLTTAKNKIQEPARTVVKGPSCVFNEQGLPGHDTTPKHTEQKIEQLPAMSHQTRDSEITPPMPIDVSPAGGKLQFASNDTGKQTTEKQVGAMEGEVPPSKCLPKTLPGNDAKDGVKENSYIIITDSPRQNLSPSETQNTTSIAVYHTTANGEETGADESFLGNGRASKTRWKRISL
ncbi:MAG: hypothetical protein N0E59_08145, partial [Candidatus Thiodiazotropha taylori]|nr:hypothetical protein [Candidatus Thiodiazotropha taylori]MCW4283067.1 hypothetical protein [Candidatus Thiodiazotropha taylori]